MDPLKTIEKKFFLSVESHVVVKGSWGLSRPLRIRKELQGTVDVIGILNQGGTRKREGGPPVKEDTQQEENGGKVRKSMKTLGNNFKYQVDI